LKTKDIIKKSVFQDCSHSSILFNNFVAEYIKVDTLAIFWFEGSQKDIEELIQFLNLKVGIKYIEFSSFRNPRILKRYFNIEPTLSFQYSGIILSQYRIQKLEFLFSLKNYLNKGKR
jgi:hypothetical protein